MNVNILNNLKQNNKNKQIDSNSNSKNILKDLFENGIYLQEPVANEFFDVDQDTFLEKFNSLKKHKDATIVFDNFGIDFYVKTKKNSY